MNNLNILIIINSIILIGFILSQNENFKNVPKTSRKSLIEKVTAISLFLELTFFLAQNKGIENS